jgi:hypothetical protein
MSKHYTVRPTKFTLRFAPAEQATVHGGQFAVAAVLERFDLKRRVQALSALDPRTHTYKGFEPCVYAYGALFSLTSGGCTLAAVEGLDGDAALKAYLGVKKFPDQSTVGEWLRAVGAPGWEALRQLNRDFVAWTLAQAEPARYQHGGRTECFFDDTQVEVYGRTFEGADFNYNKALALGWQTLWVGPLLADSVLGPPLPVGSELPDLLQQNHALWNKAHSYLYADSGSSSGADLTQISAHCDAWSVSYNRWTSALERQARDLPESAWSAPVERKGRKGEALQEQYAWLRHQPEGCATPQAFAVARSKAAEDLFWHHHFVVTHAADSTPQAVCERHRLKGDRERLFSEVLSDLDLHHPPCQALAANRVYYALATLAYNVLQALKLIWLPAEVQPQRVRTLIHQLLLVPVRLYRHARRLAACFFATTPWVQWWRRFLAEVLPRCGLAPPCRT